ncbi:MAG: alpha/beta hydrolase [Labrys sp. (in: a-proteobacteria)]
MKPSLLRRLSAALTRLGYRVVYYFAAAIILVLVGVFGVRVFDAVTGPPLAPWHLFVPEELDADAIDRASWADWMAAETRIFADVRANVTDALEPEFQTPENRYYAGSPIHNAGQTKDWNRSAILMPEGAPVGAAVFIHGLTDAPYSHRHLAEHYRTRGFVAVLLRVPGHGTVPAGLTDATWQSWAAAVRLAVREAVRLAGPGKPLHLVGYSNGGALAVDYTLSSLETEGLARPTQVVLLSPMLGITEFARFAGIAGWPSVFPSFLRAAWFSTLPEYNPYKYNSFPVNAAVQAHALTVAMQARMTRLSASGALSRLPPILTFQSIVDHTVSTQAVIRSFYERLPPNGSELVLFDLNRAAQVGPLFRPTKDTILDRLLPAPPRAYRTLVVTNAAPNDPTVVVRDTAAGASVEEIRPLGVTYPRDVFSLSHVALPFPETDGLYGRRPDPADRVGIHLGALSTLGEFGVLVIGLDQFNRMTWNPFFTMMLAQIDTTLPPRSAP